MLVPTGEKSKQPKIIEMPYGFVCTHCKNETAKITTKEELKSDFVGDTQILVEYIEDTETMEGNWFEIIDDMKKGLKIACCTCDKANDGIKITDNEIIDYQFIDDEYPQGMWLKAIVKLNKKEIKRTWRVANFKLPRPR